MILFKLAYFIIYSRSFKFEKMEELRRGIPIGFIAITISKIISSYDWIGD